MKKVFILVFIILAALVAKAQDYYVSYIVDKDGYVNVRAAANSKSDIVARLASGTVVYAYSENEYGRSNWRKISLKKGGAPIGYVHESRFGSDWPLRAYINDSKGAFTNIRNAPNGKVIVQLPTDDTYLIDLSDFQNGWWKIEEMWYINEDDDEVPFVIPANSEYWIHTSCVGSEMRGDGCLAFSLLSEPKEGARIIKYYPAGSLPSIQSILDLSADKQYLKIKLNDGNVGWVLSIDVCYSYFTVCT